MSSVGNVIDFTSNVYKGTSGSKGRKYLLVYWKSLQYIHEYSYLDYMISEGDAEKLYTENSKRVEGAES